MKYVYYEVKMDNLIQYMIQNWHIGEKFEITNIIKQELCSKFNLDSKELIRIFKSNKGVFKYKKSYDEKNKGYIHYLMIRNNYSVSGMYTIAHTETFEADEFEIIKYFNIEVIMYTPEKLINATHFCEANGKSFRHWLRNDSAKEDVELISKSINDERKEQGLDSVEIIKKMLNVPNKYKGIYIHIDLSIILAQYISPEYKIQMIKFVKNMHLREHQRKYESIIDEKNESIDKLSKKIDSQSEEIRLLLAQSKQVLEDNKTTHASLNDIKDENKNVKKELIDVKETLNDVREVLEDIKDNTVPTDGFNTFLIYKLPTSFRVVRCKSNTVNKYKNANRNYNLFFEVTLPNSIEFFLTLKDEYGCSLNQNDADAKFRYKNNTIYLKISEAEFRGLLDTHLRRIDEQINL